MKKKNPKLVWIIGFLMVAAGLYLLVSTYTPSNYKKASGTIISQSTDTGYKREISFTGEDGKLYTGTDRSFSSDRKVDVTVTVAYDPAAPEKTMRVVSDDGRTMLWGGIVALLGAGLAYLGLRRPRMQADSALPPGQVDPDQHVMHTKKHEKK